MSRTFEPRTGAPSGEAGAHNPMKKTLSALALIAGATLLAAGCAQPPTDVVNAAKAALETARTSEAADYAAESLKAAEDAVAALEAELNVQSEAFALTRSYNKTKELAAAATAAAEKAAADAQAGREAVMNRGLDPSSRRSRRTWSRRPR